LADEMLKKGGAAGHSFISARWSQQPIGADCQHQHSGKKISVGSGSLQLADASGSAQITRSGISSGT